MQQSQLHRLTNNSTFSSNLSPILVFSSSGANNVQPESSRSPSGSTREIDVAIASARILDRRIRSRGSVDCRFNRNSENTEIVLLPSMKSMTAWENQSLNVDVYILQGGVTIPIVEVITALYLARELTPSLSIPLKSRLPVLVKSP